jgi:hypothetical protein
MDCRKRKEEKKEKPYRELFYSQIDHYNKKEKYYTHMVSVSEVMVLEIFWDGSRWAYRKHELEKPVKSRSRSGTQ